MVSFAWDMSPGKVAVKRDTLVAYSSSVSHAVNTETKNPLVVPGSVLAARRMFAIDSDVNSTTCPLTLLVATDAASSSTVGELWIKYSVSLVGMHG